MTEIEKMKAAKEAWEKWVSGPVGGPSWSDWLDSEIARLEDPFAQAKHKLHGWSQSETTTPGTWNLIHYVEHLKSERDHCKIQYEHAKEAAEEWKKASGPVQIKTADEWREAAAEPLDPQRVLATAEKLLMDMIDSEYVGGASRYELTTALKWIKINVIRDAKPYEVQDDQG